MKRLKLCRLRAEEAERLAERAIGSQERAAYEQIARAWRDLEKAALR
jgi:hypothetical protein